jgi:hypothetical protein
MHPKASDSFRGAIESELLSIFIEQTGFSIDLLHHRLHLAKNSFAILD